MKHYRKILLVVAVIMFMIILTGCSNKTLAFDFTPPLHPFTGEPYERYEDMKASNFVAHNAKEKYTLLDDFDKARYQVTVKLDFERYGELKYDGEYGKANIPIYIATTRYEIKDSRSGKSAVLEKEDNPHISLQTGIVFNGKLPDFFVGQLMILKLDDINKLLSEIK